MSPSVAGCSNFANPDCQKCKIRRIQCDRSLPTCFKCGSRSLECPGYSRRIKFVSCTPQGRQKNSAGALRRHSPNPKIITSTRQVARDSLHELAQQTTFPDIFADFEDQTSASLGHQELLLHFSNFVAAQLVWVDNLHNPWRQYICPLTSKSPCVLHAVLALAAANLHVKFGSNNPHKALSLSLLEKYRQKTLDLLTPYLTSARHHDGDADGEVYFQSFREALATTLLLWHLEMHFQSNSLWRLHLRTAQALIYHSRQSSILLLGFDGCSDFLISEFYCATIWPRLTLDVEIDDMALDLPLGHGTNAFLGFVQLMQRIILLSRSGEYNDTRTDTETTMNITDLETQAAETRQAVLAAQDVMSPLPMGPSADIMHVVNAWFHAILLFGYRTITRFDVPDESMQMTRDCLFESLSSLSSPLAFAQNQPWPLFIAGTECVGDISGQLWVESRILCLINSVCPLGRPQMLDFLREWWARDGSLSDQTACWMAFKQERAKSGKEFVIW